MSLDAPLKKKTPRHATIFDLGLGKRYSSAFSEADARIAAPLASSHPRQFWLAAKRILRDRSQRNATFFAAFDDRPALIRAALMLILKSPAQYEVLGESPLFLILSSALRLPGRTSAFYEARLEGLRRLRPEASASEVYSLIAAPALVGHAVATLAAAKAMPDPRGGDPSQARAFSHGQTSFASAGLYSPELLAQAAGIIHAQVHGISDGSSRPPQPPPCSNAFFLIAHRYRQSLAAGLAEASLWRDAGMILINRIPALSGEAPLTALMLGTEPFRRALAASLDLPAPKWSYSRGFASQLSDGCLFDALAMASPQCVGDILALAARRPPAASIAPGPDGSPGAFVGGIPRWALALLAGHPPAPEWMPEPSSPEALAEMRFPKAWVAKAKDGSLLSSDLEGRGRVAPGDPPAGAKISAAKLCKALGSPWPAQPPKLRSKQSPKG